MATTLARAVADREGGLSFDAEGLSLAEFLRHWLTDSVRDSVRAATYDGYDRQVRNHLSPALGQIKLKALSPPISGQCTARSWTPASGRGQRSTST